MELCQSDLSREKEYTNICTLQPARAKKQNKMDRLLIIGPPHLNKNSLLPIIAPGEFGDGAIHPLTITTKYYTARIDAWLDDVEDWEEWSTLFQSDEAQEVRDVLNGVILCFDFNEGVDSLKHVLNTLQPFIDRLKQSSEDSWDGVLCCVGFGSVSDIDDFEDICLPLRWECLDIESKEEWNEYREPLGVLKLRQVIESHEWTTTDEKTTGDEEKDTNTELTDLVSHLQEAKSHIGSLPMEERHQHALKFLESLNLGGLEAEVLDE